MNIKILWAEVSIIKAVIPAEAGMTGGVCAWVKAIKKEAEPPF